MSGAGQVVKGNRVYRACDRWFLADAYTRFTNNRTLGYRPITRATTAASRLREFSPQASDMDSQSANRHH